MRRVLPPAGSDMEENMANEGRGDKVPKSGRNVIANSEQNGKYDVQYKSICTRAFTGPEDAADTIIRLLTWCYPASGHIFPPPHPCLAKQRKMEGGRRDKDRRRERKSTNAAMIAPQCKPSVLPHVIPNSFRCAAFHITCSPTFLALGSLFRL